MAYPNTLIFVDLASDEPEAAGEFYARVFGWKNEGRQRPTPPRPGRRRTQNAQPGRPQGADPVTFMQTLQNIDDSEIIGAEIEAAVALTPM